ncbi:NAD(P)-dependent dehydrogenase (short-subunit alcohol dehydrogenase family) [Phyllobacterium sp. 1468]|nr:NAD(P)-dependent dehydrogenase (short-subunit alcohol dehydrogenase family) [Phyllobacterium sp. 1468]
MMNKIAPASAEEFLSGLRDQRVLVTAGGSGIGYAIAATLSRLGARVAICDISQSLLNEAQNSVSLAHATLADVSREQDVDRMFEEVSSSLGGLDALINNAGIAGPTGGVDEINTEDWRRCIDICLTGQFLCARRAVPMLKASGGGSIVNMSSAAGKHGYAFRTPYSAAKFGVIGLTQSLAKELGPHAIRVNAILPGIVEGPRIENVISNRAKQLGISHEEMTERYLENVSLRRMVSPYDVATMVAFLLSNAGLNVSGQSLGVDGNVETL